MRDSELEEGAVVGSRRHGSRWRAVVVIIKIGKERRFGYCVLADDEGVPKEMPGVTGAFFRGCCDEFYVVAGRYGIPPAFDASDFYIVRNGVVVNLGSHGSKKLSEEYERVRKQRGGR